MPQNKRFVDEAGKIYGKLTVIERVSRKVGDQGSVQWICKCSCGNTSIVYGTNLRMGTTTSCGCNRKLPDGESSFNKLISVYKKHARNRGYRWNLTTQQFRDITQRNCFYCGKPPSQKYSLRKHENGEYLYNGIDRLDNTKGYSIKNCVPCCGFCNHAKDIIPVNSFREWIISVYENFAKSH